MGKLVRLERDIYSGLKEHAQHLDSAARDIEDYVREVAGVYSECGDSEECDDQQTESILGNPIHNYQLLKRVTVTWKKVLKTLKAIDGKSILSKIKKRKKKEKLPTDIDLNLAAKSLNNLKDVYRIPADEMAEGNLLGVQTGAKLNEQDLFYLASSAANQNNHKVAVDLLEHSTKVLVLKNVTSDDVNLRKVNILLNKERRRLPPILEEEIVLGQVPAKTTDYNKLTTHQDRVNYEALCRGDSLLPHHVTRTLTCSYSTRGDPYYTLHPLAVEVVHPAPHLVLVFHRLLSARESAGLAALASSSMKQSGIGREKALSELRRSESAWIEDGASELVDGLSRRMNWVTGLQTSQLWDRHQEGRREEYEFLQLGSYGTGGYYNVHQDPLFVYKDHNYIAGSVEAQGSAAYLTGDRMSTLMFYLTEVTAGGLTAFPRLGLAVRPELGSAVLWHNLHEDGWSDMAMLHGGCPVLLGRKIVANKWIREVANMFTRKCLLHPNIHAY